MNEDLPPPTGCSWRFGCRSEDPHRPHRHGVLGVAWTSGAGPRVAPTATIERPPVRLHLDNLPELLVRSEA